MKLLFPTIFHEFQVPTFNEKEKELIKYVYGEKRKDPGIENEKRRLNNEAVQKSITRRGDQKHHG